MELKPAEVQSWYKVITDFPEYYRAFSENYNGLLSQHDYVYYSHPELVPEYEKLMAEGTQLKGKLDSVNAAIDGVMNVFHNAGTTIEDWLSDSGDVIGGTAEMAWYNIKDLFNLNGLGILPIIWAGMAVGTAAGVLIAVGKWLTTVQQTASRINRAKELEAQGLTPTEVTERVKAEYGSGDESTFFGIAVKWWLLGAVAIFVLPPLIGMIRDRKRLT